MGTRDNNLPDPRDCRTRRLLEILHDATCLSLFGARLEAFRDRHGRAVRLIKTAIGLSGAPRDDFLTAYLVRVMCGQWAFIMCGEFLKDPDVAPRQLRTLHECLPRASEGLSLERSFRYERAELISGIWTVLKKEWPLEGPFASTLSARVMWPWVFHRMDRAVELSTEACRSS
jgi:hypothetical protein